MKIINKTDYATKDLKKIFMACERFFGSNSKTRIVTVVKCHRGVHGRAFLKSNRLTMKFASAYSGRVFNGNGEWVDYATPTPLSSHHIAKVYLHEVEHNHGFRHKEMIKWWNYKIDFIEDYGVLPKGEKQHEDKFEKEIDSINKKIKQWSSKRTRAEKAIK